MFPNAPASIPTAPLAAIPKNHRAMVVDDEAGIRGPLTLYLETLGLQVVEAASAEDAIRLAGAAPLDIVFLDIRLGTSNGLDAIARLLASNPRVKIVIITAYASVDVAVRAMIRGATEFLCKPFTPDQVAAVVKRITDLRTLEDTVGIAVDATGTAGPDADFATTSKILQDAILLAREVAPALLPVLIRGQRGTGKRVLAHAIHGWSSRPETPIHTLDCSARSPAYIDVALFGDTLVGEQIVTGDNPPLIESAASGTLLLRNVDALSPRSQLRLTRLIERREIELPNGQYRPSDLRIIATLREPSAAPLLPALQNLLESIQIRLPALHERSDDIPMLAQRYLAQARQSLGKATFGFSVGAINLLIAYPWPGNLTELYTATRDSVVAADTHYVEPHHLPPAIQSAGWSPNRLPRAGDSIALRELETAHIRAIITSSQSLQEAADKLGIDLQALYRRRKQYGLE